MCKYPRNFLAGGDRDQVFLRAGHISTSETERSKSEYYETYFMESVTFETPYLPGVFTRLSKGLAALRVDAFWCSSVIGVDVRAGIAVCRLDTEQVVVGAKRRINRRTPLPVNGNAG